MPTITKTACVLYDHEHRILPMRRMRYDTRRALERLKKAGLPSDNGQSPWEGRNDSGFISGSSHAQPLHPFHLCESCDRVSL